MARNRLNYKQFAFTGGKITEATFFNQPDNTARTLTNFSLETSGEVRRRLGINREAGGSNSGLWNLSNLEVSSYLWKSVNGEADSEILVVQVGYELRFYDFTQSPLSANYINNLDLSSYTRNSENYRLEFASGEGVLFVVAKNLEPLYITEDSGNFTATQIEIKVRDLDGVDDGLDNETRPSNLSVLHEYNLRNQGWPLSLECSTEIRNPNTIEGDSIQLQDPVAYTKTKLGVYPSNADVHHLAKRTFPNGMLPYEPFRLEELALGNTKAARGKFILNAFSKDRVSASSNSNNSGTVVVQNGQFGTLTVTLPQEFIPGVEGLSTQTVDSRPTAVAFFSGRAFFAGREAGSKSTRLFFSQFLTDITRVNKCYQEQDPTAEQLNGILATDGGVVPMPDAGEVRKLIPFRSGIIIIAENGVWFLAGSPDTGFTATDYTIQKVSDETSLSASSVVVAGNRVLWWGEHGIYALSLQEQGELRAENIAERTIQTQYNSISSVSKRFAKGFYDPERNEVSWCYTQDLTRTNNNFSDSILFFNLNLGAFYDYTISGGDVPFLVNPVDKSGLVRGTELSNVVDSSGVTVTDSFGNNVTVTLVNFTGNASSLKFLTFVPSSGVDDFYTITFSEFNNSAFIDWDFYTDTAYTSELETSWFVLDDGARDKQIQWLLLHFRRTETDFSVAGFADQSSALVRVKHEFTSSSSTNRWSDQYQAYRLNPVYLDDGDFDYGYDVVTHKKRVRGHGRGISFSLTSEAGKDLRLLGFDITFSGRSRV